MKPLKKIEQTLGESNDNPSGISRKIESLLFFGVWTIVALVSALVFYATRKNADLLNPWAWWELIVLKLLVWYLWAVLSLLILKFSRLFRTRRDYWVKWLSLHLFLSITVTSLYMAAYTWIIISFWSEDRPEPIFEQMYATLVSLHFTYYYLAYWAVIGYDYVAEYYRDYRENEIQTERLQKNLAQARLDNLKSQLHPHFLFNTLHMIGTFAHTDPAKADMVLEKLSDLLRMSFTDMSTQETSLLDELEFTKLYLEIQQTRFCDRLQFEVDVDSSLLDAKVPSLILQPIVENAIMHGVNSHSRQASVIIRASQIDRTLELKVFDNGPGLPKSWVGEADFNLGLSNTVQRLRQLYADHQSISLSNLPSGGVEATIRLPLSFANESTGS